VVRGARAPKGGKVPPRGNKVTGLCALGQSSWNPRSVWRFLVEIEGKRDTQDSRGKIALVKEGNHSSPSVGGVAGSGRNGKIQMFSIAICFGAGWGRGSLRGGRKGRKKGRGREGGTAQAASTAL